ncbi:hypothetical protein ACHAQH_008755 [Verticillium albo-atrum]
MQLIQNIIPFTLLGMAAAAYDPAVDSDCPNEGICLSSFKWCYPHQANTRASDCYWPEGASPYWGGVIGGPVILHVDREFDLEWRNADPSLPVNLKWGGTTPGSMPVESDDDRHVYFFETNISSNGETTGTYRFKPYEILYKYRENPMPNVTMETAWLVAHTLGGRLYINQPGADLSTDAWPENSDEFVLVDRPFEWMINGMKRDFKSEFNANQKKWGLGVGIGVGLGFPLAIAITWVVARRTATSYQLAADDK